MRGIEARLLSRGKLNRLLSMCRASMVKGLEGCPPKTGFLYGSMNHRQYHTGTRKIRTIDSEIGHHLPHHRSMLHQQQLKDWRAIYLCDRWHSLTEAFRTQCYQFSAQNDT